MLIKDLQDGNVREYGADCHDSLMVSQDGRTLSYYNLQNGDGSNFGDYRFVMEDGEVPERSQTPDAIHAECYFNIGGFTNYKKVRNEVAEEMAERLIKHLKTKRMLTIEEITNYIDWLKNQIKEGK